MAPIIHWNKMIRFRSPAERKHLVEKIFLEVLNELGVERSDFFTLRSLPVRTARHRLSVIARELLCDFMSDVEIAEFIGIPRTTYLGGVELWAEENGE